MADRDLSKLLLRLADNTEAQTARFSRTLAVRYRDAYREMEGQVASLYAKLGNEPTLIEARKYGRLQSVMAAIQAEYKAITGKAITGTRSNSAQSYTNAVYGTQWAYDQTTGVAIKWPLLPIEAIRASVWSSDTGEQFAARFKNWYGQDVRKMQAIITRGLAMGQGYDKTARQMRDQINVSFMQSERIVRTESARNFTQGHLQVYNDLESVGVKARKKWVATLDTRTRDTHGALDGTYADEDGLFHIHGDAAEGPGLFSDPAESINCRCRIVEEIDNLAPDLRRIRGGGIVAYQSFSDWAGARGWTESRGWPAGAKAEVSAEQAQRY